MARKTTRIYKSINRAASRLYGAYFYNQEPKEPNMNNKRYNIGTVGMTMETNGFPKGLILKRDLTLRECKHILGNLLGIELFTREV